MTEFVGYRGECIIRDLSVKGAGIEVMNQTSIRNIST
jgi:uncharacterized Zn ribbon protein